MCSSDLFSKELLGRGSLFWRYARVVLKLVGEPMSTFGLDNTPPARQHAAAFVKSCGLTLEEHRNFGQETAQHRPEAGFAVATVKPEGHA